MQPDPRFPTEWREAVSLALCMSPSDEWIAQTVAGTLAPLLAERERNVIEAVARHARTLDDRSLGHPEHVRRDRDSIDNELYNVVRALDPAWWDARVPGLCAAPTEDGGER